MRYGKETARGGSFARTSLSSVSRLALTALVAPVALHATSAAAQTADPAAAQTADPLASTTSVQNTTNDQSAAQAADSNEIVVTAQFRRQSLQTTPIAITAVSGAQLEQRGQTNIVEVAQQAPGVNLQESNPQGPSLQAHIRGIGQTDFSYSFEPGVGVYVDDVYYSTLTGSVLDLLDLDRVEVLRGPQGTLAGMNSIGGAIKLYTKRPNGKGGGYVEATLGSLNRTDLRASADFSLVPDKLFARVSGVTRNQDGYVTRYDFACTHPDLAATYNIPSQAENGHCKLGTEGGKSYVSLRGSLRWLATPDLEVNITGDVTRDRSEAAPETLVFVGSYKGNTYTPGLGSLVQTYPMYSTAPVNGLNLWNPATGTSPFISYSPWGVAGDTFTKSPYVTYATYSDDKPIEGSAPFRANPVSRVSGWGVSGNIEYRISDDVKLTSITAYRTYKADWVQDFDATQLSNALITYHTTNWQFSEEARLNASLLDNKVDLVIGGFYLDRKSTYSGTVDQGLRIFTEDDDIPAHNWAAFANASWRITDKLELNAGIRYSDETKTFLFGRGGRAGIVPNGPYQPCYVNGQYYGIVHVGFCGLNGAKGTYSGSNVDYRAVLQYQWTPDVMTYASIATGFKGGGINPRPFYPDQARPFGPEKLTAYEIGFKSSFFDHRARLNVSAYLNKYSDFIASVGSTVAAPPNTGCYFNTSELLCSYFVNSGDATIKGVELEAQVEPVDGFTIEGSASFLDFKYDKLSGCAPALSSSCPAPSGGLGAGLRYGMMLPYTPKRQFSLGAQYVFDLGGIGTLTPRVDWSYQSKQEADSINNALAKLPSYSLLNAKLTWNSEDRDWQVSLQVTNVTKELYYVGIGPNNNSMTTAANPGMPREWWVSLKRSF